MLMLLAVMPLLAEKVNIGIINTGVYLMVPYLLTCIISCKVIDRIRGKEIPIYCAGAAAFVSTLGFLLNSVQSTIYQERYFVFWVAILVALVALLFRGLRQLINNMEEMKCNLSLTD
jgi:MFS family permease